MGTHRITVELADDSYQILRKAVESGEYESERDVIISGLLALDGHESPSDEEEVDVWLRDEVVPIALRMRANPGSGYTSEEVLAHLESDLREFATRPNAA